MNWKYRVIKVRVLFVLFAGPLFIVLEYFGVHTCEDPPYTIIGYIWYEGPPCHSDTASFGDPGFEAGGIIAILILIILMQSGFRKLRAMFKVSS